MELRRTLRKSRDELSVALDQLNSSATEVPSLGADELAEVPSEFVTDDVRKRRAAVAQAIALASAEERALREVRAQSLLDEVRALNRVRLGLLPALSAAKRDAITGFTVAGFEQARSEARHLFLILRYHRHIVLGWIESLRGDGRPLPMVARPRSTWDGSAYAPCGWSGAWSSCSA